jgi:hypothetical protein
LAAAQQEKSTLAAQIEQLEFQLATEKDTAAKTTETQQNFAAMQAELQQLKANTKLQQAFARNEMEALKAASANLQVDGTEKNGAAGAPRSPAWLACRFPGSPSAASPSVLAPLLRPLSLEHSGLPACAFAPTAYPLLDVGAAVPMGYG